MINARRVTILVFGLLAVTLILATGQQSATETQTATASADPQWIADGVEAGTLRLVDPEEFEFPGTTAAKGKKPRCTDCSITLGDSCERFSCNPCCYTCEGLPYLVCLE